MNNWNIKNIKSPLTSIIGLILMGLAVYVYLLRPDSEMFSLALLALGAVAFGLKDPRIPPAGGLIPLVLIMLLTTSCVTFKKCSDKFGTGEKHTITVRDTIKVIDTVYIEPDSVKGNIPLNDLMSGKVDSLVHTSSSLKLQIKLWYDKYTGLLHYRADVKPDTVVKIKEVPVEVKGDCPETIIFDPEKGAPAWHRWLNGYKNFSAWALLLMIIVLVAIIRNNR